MSTLNQRSERHERFDLMFADCRSRRRDCRNCRQREFKGHVGGERDENLSIQLIRALMNENPPEKSKGFSFIRGYVMGVRGFRSDVSYFTAN